MSIALRTATPADVARLSEIAIAAKAYWGYPRAWIEQWRAELTIAPADLARWTVRVAAGADGIPLGFAATAAAQPRWEVEHLWVDPAAMQHGIGRMLLRDALAMAHGGGALGLVIVSDPHAAGFYERLGGRPDGVHPAPMPGDPDRSLPRFRLDAVAR